METNLLYSLHGIELKKTIHDIRRQRVRGFEFEAYQNRDELRIVILLVERSNHWVVTKSVGLHVHAETF